MERKPRRLGYLRGTNIPAIHVSAIVGILLAGALATRIAFNNPPGPEPWLRPVSILIMMVIFSPLSIWLTWQFLADKTTCSTTVKNPENSIEKHWSAQAATWTCWIILDGTAIMGIIAYYTLSNLVSYTLLTVAVVGCLVYGISYLIAKIR